MKFFLILNATFCLVFAEYDMKDINNLYLENIKVMKQANTCELRKGICCYNQATKFIDLTKDSTESNEALSQFHEMCHQNVSSTMEDDECQYPEELYNCLQTIVCEEYKNVEEKCTNEYTIDTIDKYLQANVTELIENESYACKDLCFHIGVGKMNEDLTFNYLEDDFLEDNWTDVDPFKAAEECIKISEIQNNRCSMGSHRAKCLQAKLLGIDLEY